MTGTNSQQNIGEPIERHEDLRFLAGTGRFVDDVTPTGALHAAILRSPVAHGEILEVDLDYARDIPGVVRIITAADIGAEIPIIPIRLAPIDSYEFLRQPVIAKSRVRYVGEPIAVVVATSRAIAEDALDVISIDIDIEPAITQPLSESEGALFDEVPDNVATHYKAGFGEVDSAFSEAEYSRSETFYVHRHSAIPMETRGLVAEWHEEEERLVVTGAGKVPFFNRKILAQMLGLDLTQIDLLEVDIGGGFGVRGEFYPEDFLIPFVALRLGRPVKWVEDRREHMMATNHSRDVHCTLEIACTKDGVFTGLRGKVIADMGAYIRTNGGVVPAKAAQFLPGPYRIPNVEVEVTACVTNKTPVGTYRGPGRFEANFFRERLIDMIARDLAIDPVEIRRRNLITSAELPYSIGKLVPYEPETAYDTGDYLETLERCLSEIDWVNKAHLQGSRADDGRRHGIGLACFVEIGGHGPKENVRLKLSRDGTLEIYVGSSLLGQGLETVFAQIASDHVGLPMSSIKVFHGSTTYVDEGFGTYASRAVIMGGSAIIDAAKTFKKKLRSAVAAMWGEDNVAIQFDGDTVRSSDQAVSLKELAAYADEQGIALEANGSFSQNKRTYSYGAHAAHVAVDIETGDVKVLDYVAVEDIGRAINPLIVHGQVIGGIVQGLGGVFLDHFIYDKQGQLLNASFADYLLPTATDFPNVRAVSLENYPSLTNPLGAKGVGEGGMVAVAGAVSNAVGAALAPLGIEPRELPLSPPNIWKLVQEAGLNKATDDDN